MKSAQYLYVARLATLVVLLEATCYQVCVAVGLIPLGSQGGEGPAGGSAIMGIGLFALVVGAALCWLAASRPGATGESVALLLAPVGAAFMTAHFYAFDPYFLPTLRRISAGGFLPAPWIFALAGLTIVAAVVAYLRRGVGLRMASVLLVLCAVTTIYEGSGH